MKASDYDGDLSEFLKRYKYQPDLTRRLDDLGRTELTQELINEIVLWKLNRYVSLNSNLLAQVETLKRLKRREHRKAESALV